MEVTDGVLRGQARNIASAGARRMNAAVPIRSNLLGLEHRLQTVVDGDGWAAAILLSRRYSATRPRRHTPPAHVPHRRLRLPCSFKGVGGQLFVRIRSARKRRNGSKPAFACGLSFQGRHRGGRAEALTGHNRNIHRQPPLHKAASTELASGPRFMSQGRLRIRRKLRRSTPLGCRSMPYIGA